MSSSLSLRSQEEWCWAATSVAVTVAASDVTDVQLTQTGYRLTVVTSHPTEILYSLAPSSPAADAAGKDSATVSKDSTTVSKDSTTVSKDSTTATGKDPAAAAAGAAGTPSPASPAHLTTGTNTLCVPAPGVYRLEPRGCHQFQEPAVLADTASPAAVQLRAVSHRVSGSVRCEQATRDVRASLSVEAEARELETEVEEGGRVHRFAVQARPGQVLTFQPQSDTMLFTPTYRQLTAGEDCMEEAVTFQARRGTFISGQWMGKRG